MLLIIATCCYSQLKLHLTVFICDCCRLQVECWQRTTGSRGRTSLRLLLPPLHRCSTSVSDFVWHATRLTGVNQLPLSQQTSSPSLIDIGMHGASQVVLL